MARKNDPLADLPPAVTAYIRRVARRVKMSRRVRREVACELGDHFRDALADCEPDRRDERAAELLGEFGDPAIVGKLIRRGKKRCRPLWKKAIIRGFQAVGVLILLYALNLGWLMFLAEPTISVDYVARINDYVHPKVGDEFNARPLYLQAMDLYVTPTDALHGPVKKTRNLALGSMPRGGVGNPLQDILSNPQSYRLSGLSDEQRDMLDTYLAANDAAWQQFVAGSRKPAYWPEYSTPDDGWMIGILLPHLHALRTLSKDSIWRSWIALEQGRNDDAVDAQLVCVRVGAHMQHGRGTLIEQLVGMAISNQASQAVREHAADERLTAGQLARLQHEMQAVYADGHPTIDLELEKTFFLDCVQRCFTDGGPGGGQLLPQKLNWLRNWEPGKEPDFELKLLGAPLTAGRDETLAVGIDYYEQIAQRAKKSPYELQQNTEPSPYDRLIVPFPYHYPLLHVILPALDRAAALSWRARAEHEAAIAVLALRRWRLEEGRYPESLENLVAEGYLTALPGDPYSDGPLRYRREGDDFILYSIGEDFKDDGGLADWGEFIRPDGTLDYRPGGWGERDGGDHIFWPLEPTATFGPKPEPYPTMFGVGAPGFGGPGSPPDAPAPTSQPVEETADSTTAPAAP